MKFWGYKRKNGTIGIRNKVLILPTVSCSAEVAKTVSNQVYGTVAIQNHLGCGQIGKDLDMTRRTLKGLAMNPNIFGVIVLGLGCETVRPNLIASEIAESGKPVEVITIQNEGGTLNATLKGIRLAIKMVQAMSVENKVECDVSELVLAVECGGSDPTSGIIANPVTGLIADRIVQLGGTVILSETTEFIGAEHILARRGKNPEVSKMIFDIVNQVEERAKYIGANIRGGNPSPGNIEGGLSTLEEKSLGCIHKAGSSPINEVLPYAQSPSEKGLVIMDSPGFDVDSVTGMVASGAQLCLFTTGLGTGVGNPIAPVIKMTGNPITFRKMEDNLDINAGKVIEDRIPLGEFSEEVFADVLAVANGRMTKAEILKFSESSIWRCGTSF